MGQKVYFKNEQDFRCAYYKNDNSWNVLWGDEFNSGTGIDSFKECLLSHFTTCKNEHIKVFMNNVIVIGTAFKGKFYGEHSRGEHAQKKEVLGMTLSTTKNGNKVELCNLNMFINDAMIHYFEEDECPAVLMTDYLNHISNNPFEIKKSLGYMSKKKFYGPIRNELQLDIIGSNRNLINETMYNHLKTGNRSGFLVNGKDDAEVFKKLGQSTLGITIDEKIWTSHVDEYDLNSAYISTIISDFMFPVGRVFYADNTDSNIEEIFERCLKEARWFKIYIPHNTKIDTRIATFCHDCRTNDYGVEYYDYKALVEFWGMTEEQFKKIIKKDGVVLYWANSGYVHKLVRDRTNEYYKNKKNPEIKGTIYGDLAKQENELIYGKALQDISFKDSNVLQGKLSDGINYLQPHMALHCTAAVRYRLMKAYFENMETVTYYDTDSIHGTDLEEYIEVDNSINAFNNAMAGFEGSTVGMWKTEQKDSTEILFAPKQRLCLNNGEFIVRVCGIGRKCVEEHIRKLKLLGLDNRMIMEHFYMNGFDDVMIPVYLFDPTKGFERKEIDFETFKKEYGKDDE